MAECRSCGAKIKWIKTLRGKYMPCDPEKVTIVTMNTGRVIQGYIPHWATCPNAANHKKKKRKEHEYV